MIWSELVTHYLRDCLARGQSPRTVEAKRSALSFFTGWCNDEHLHDPAQLTLGDLERYRVFTSEVPGRRGAFLDLASQRNRLTAVRVFLRRVARARLIPTDPGLEFELPRVPRRLPPNILTHEQVESVMRAALEGRCGVRDRAIVETLYATGIRRMELVNLDLTDIDFGRGLLLVRRGKGGKDRRVPLATRATQWIQRYAETRRPLARDPGALFLTTQGKRFLPHQLSDLMSGLLRRADIRASGACKIFRHTAASLMHENGADILHVKEMLGHADVSTTQVYVHVTLKTLRKVYARTHPAARPKRRT